MSRSSFDLMIQFFFFYVLSLAAPLTSLHCLLCLLNNDSKLRKKLFHIMHAHKLTVTERPIFTEALLSSRDELLDTAGPGRGHQLTSSPLLQGQWSNKCLHVLRDVERMPAASHH